MNKIRKAVIGSLVLGTCVSPRAFSVVPTPLSLEEDSDLNANSVTASTSPRSTGQVAEKLAEDQRRLESVLQDLKEDQKALKRLESKENPNGYPLH